MTQLIVEPYTADNAKELVQSALESELRMMKFGIDKTIRKLKDLENKFGIDSEVFYKKFNAGNIGDDSDYIRWAGEYETLHQLQQDYKDLTDVRLC
ncbi:MAG: hypothetical protein BWK80_36705 [Desulfobacteraceae bacterium IS3]|nr:MAG: hypothetical protein BWK80_36705 [Desulfobacteraceae bacterium IS3]